MRLLPAARSARVSTLTLGAKASDVPLLVVFLAVWRSAGGSYRQTARNPRLLSAPTGECQ